MSIEMTLTVRTECQWCGGTGKRETLAGTENEACGECHGVRVAERQMGLREFRHKMEENVLVEQEEADAASGYDHHIATECM